MANDSQSRTARRKQHKKKKKPIWKRIFLIMATCILVVGLGVGAVFTYFIATAPDIDAALLSDPASTKLRDMDGEVFADLGTEKRTKINYGDLPDVLLDAVIATEDARFEKHIGIDFRRIGAAIMANITDGFGSQGASTITQQVVKDSFLSTKKTLKRKVQEQWLAIKIDSDYSKQEIMEMYLNKIYYGAGAYGVAKAAEIYFGKTDLSELTLPEAALLAGLPQRPSAYDPFQNPELAKERMTTVLSLMVQHNKITQEQANEAMDVSIESMLVEKRPDSSPYESFIQKVAREVEEKTGANIYKDSLDVYTTLDRSAQEHVEFLLSNKDDNPIQYPDEELQAGLTVLDTKTGAIRAIGGGRNREAGGFNYALDIENRQPGSTIKPITAYGPAIESQNWSTYHQLNDDSPYEVAGSTPIQNWNRKYQGWMSMRYALQWSLNVPAVKTLEEVGYGVSKSFAESLGIKFYNDKMTIRDAIGGTETGVTPLQLAGAYRAFGNEGIYNEPYSVIKVVYNAENRTEELKPKPTAVMSESTAYMVTDMLKTVVTSGTGTSANVSGLPIAGKTGTTSLPDQSGSPDSWFSGYTTNYTIAVWTGYNDQKRTIPDTKVAQYLFRSTMSKLSEGINTPDFSQPDSVVRIEIEKGSNPARLPSDYTPNSQRVTELFVKGHEPTKESQKYDQLDPVSGLKAQYNQEQGSIAVSWEYNQDSDKEVSFEIRAGTNGSLNKLATIKETEIEVSEIERGKTHTFEVVVISDENNSMTSEAASISVEVPEEEKEEIEEDSEEETDDPANENQGNNGNANSGNNGNNGNNGNGNGNGNQENENNDEENNEEGNNEEENNEDDVTNPEDIIDGLNDEDTQNNTQEQASINPEQTITIRRYAA